MQIVFRNRWLSSIGLAFALTAPAHAGISLHPSTLDLVTGSVFGGANGDVTGDVNADGKATAADFSGALFGWRNPTQPGPYGVGVRRLTFVKESAFNPGEQRTLRTDIWYPGPPGTGPIPQMPGGQGGAPLADGLGSLPLLMFSHGSCGFPSQSIALTPYFASYGFVVVAPPHPGNMINEILTCGSQAATTQSFVERPEDVRFVLDQMLALNADPESFFFGAIDPGRIGMSGHSFGGLTTYRVTAMDERVVAGLALAPAFFGIEDEVRSIDVPMMVMGGTLDSVTEFDEDIGPSFDLLGPPRYLVEIHNTGHYAFNDVCLGGPECAASALTQEEAALRVRRYAVPFVQHYVAGSNQLDAFLLPASMPPGFTVIEDLE